jgi:hypothetical protein
MSKYTEQRQATRHQIEVPIRYDHGVGKTRDVSLSGVYFTTDKLLEAGQHLRMLFELAFAIPGKSLHLDCQGYVLRVEDKAGQFGIAAVIEEITYLH